MKAKFVLYGLAGAAIARRLLKTVAVLATAGYMHGAQALVIDLTFATPNQSCLTCSNFGSPRFGGPAHTFGGGTLEAVFNAAARTWENLLYDDRHFRITVGGANLGPFVLAAAALTFSDQGNEILVNNNFYQFFADPTPFQNEEFGGYQETLADMGGGMINTRRAFDTSIIPNLRGVDLFTTALHEIGHVLGSPGDGSHIRGTFGQPLFEIFDGPFAGTQLPCDGSGSAFCVHLSRGMQGTVMNPNAGFPAERALISGADLLYVAADGRFRNFDQNYVSGVSMVPEPATWASLLLGLMVIGGAYRRKRV